MEQMAALYFSIRIWGAPATLIGFVGTGFLVGIGRSKILLGLQLFLNGLNILLDILLAGVLGLGAAGIALEQLFQNGVLCFLVLFFCTGCCSR